MPVRSQSEGIKRWLTDKSDNMTSNALVPAETSSNSYLPSDVDDHVPEEDALEVRSGLTQYLYSFFFVCSSSCFSIFLPCISSS